MFCPQVFCLESRIREMDFEEVKRLNGVIQDMQCQLHKKEEE